MLRTVQLDLREVFKPRLNHHLCYQKPGSPFNEIAHQCDI
jgi:hypothetical protein